MVPSACDNEDETTRLVWRVQKLEFRMDHRSSSPLIHHFLLIDRTGTWCFGFVTRIFRSYTSFLYSKVREETQDPVFLYCCDCCIIQVWDFESSSSSSPSSSPSHYFSHRIRCFGFCWHRTGSRSRDTLSVLYSEVSVSCDAIKVEASDVGRRSERGQRANDRHPFNTASFACSLLFCHRNLFPKCILSPLNTEKNKRMPMDGPQPPWPNNTRPWPTKTMLISKV